MAGNAQGWGYWYRLSKSQWPLAWEPEDRKGTGQDLGALIKGQEAQRWEEEGQTKGKGGRSLSLQQSCWPREPSLAGFAG